MAKPRRSSWAAVVTLLLVFGAIFIYGQTQSGSGKPEAARPEHVILISVDGMPPDYYTAPEKLGLRVPTLTMMKNGGAYA